MIEITLVSNRFNFSSAALRDDGIEKLKKCADEVAQNPDSGVYSISTPREDDKTTVFVIEGYVSRAAADKQNETPIFKEFYSWASSSNAFAGAPHRRYLRSNPSMHFHSPGANTPADPFVIFAELGFQTAEGRNASLPYWQAVIDTGRDKEPGTLMYGVFEDTDDPTKLCTWEVYDVEKSWAEVHSPGQAVQDVIKNTQSTWDGLTKNTLENIGGWMYKESMDQELAK